MIRTAVFLVIIALRIFYQPDDAKASMAPFTSPLLPSTAGHFNPPAKLTSFTGHAKNNKVLLEWFISGNEDADQFEIEKSTDGVNFTLAALVFGTDLPDSGKYSFYEKAGKKKTRYRIKMIHKNKNAEYSPVLEVGPAV